MYSILFVDDEQETILSMRRYLHTFHQNWKVTFVASTGEALEQLKVNRYDVIVGDIRMPGIPGDELLEQIKKQYPQTIRIILSRHTDRETLYQASGLVHHYISKPCPVEKIVEAIRLALSTGNFVADEKLRDLLGRLKTIPSQPRTYLRIMEELNKPETTTAEIGKIISEDPSMSAKIIQLINSAFFGLPQTVIDPVQATTLLGVETIRDLAFCLGIFSQFNADRLEKLSLHTLWNHSQRTSKTAKMIVTQLKGNKNQISHALVAGLLHDIGKLVIADNLPSTYLKILQGSKVEKAPFTAVEQKILGTDHAHLGGYLLGLWGLPRPVVYAVAGHHSPAPDLQEFPLELIAVHVANVIDYRVIPGQPVAGALPEFDQELLTQYNLGEQVEAWRQIASAR